MTTEHHDHNLQVLTDALSELETHKRRLLNSPSGDIGRIEALEKIIAYASTLSVVAAWTLSSLQYPAVAARSQTQPPLAPT